MSVPKKTNVRKDWKNKNSKIENFVMAIKILRRLGTPNQCSM